MCVFCPLEKSENARFSIEQFGWSPIVEQLCCFPGIVVVGKISLYQIVRSKIFIKRTAGAAVIVYSLQKSYTSSLFFGIKL